MDEALRDANQFNFEIVSQAAEGIIVYDRNLRCVAWNRFMERMTGTLAEDVIGRNALDLFPYLHEQGVDRLLKRALKGEMVTSPDMPFHSTFKDQRVWVAGTYAPHKNARGKIIGVIATLKDITERKRTEEELRWNAAVLEAQVESSLDGILVVDRQGRRIITNQRLLTMWDVPQPIIDQEIDEALLKNVLGRVKDPDQKGIEKAGIEGNEGVTNRTSIQTE
jgi:PAS domain S-box-containing protein